MLNVQFTHEPRAEIRFEDFDSLSACSTSNASPIILQELALLYMRKTCHPFLGENGRTAPGTPCLPADHVR
jgi:hypothetical protein